jgi:hypothetical protein
VNVEELAADMRPAADFGIAGEQLVEPRIAVGVDDARNWKFPLEYGKVS